MKRKVQRDRSRAALLVVDIQPDFLPEGALAVADGDQILPGIAGLMTAGGFAHVVATQDWHPEGHVSFASSHDGREPFERIELHGREQVLWPDHCVQGSPGAALAEGMPWSTVRAVVRKGTDPRVDSYSGFRNNWDADGRRPHTGLAGLLRELGVERLYLCGLARDFCVAWSAEDAIDAGFDTHVVWDLTRSVDPSGDGDVRRGLEERGVVVTELSTLG